MVKEEVQKIIIKTAEPILAKKVASQFSINSALKKSDEKEEITVVADKKELPSNHFSEPDLHTEWKDPSLPVRAACPGVPATAPAPVDRETPGRLAPRELHRW